MIKEKGKLMTVAFAFNKLKKKKLLLRSFDETSGDILSIIFN